MKTCTECGTERALDDFRQRKLKSSNGLYRLGVCRICERETQKKYRLANLEKCKKALADWKKSNPDRNAAHSRLSYYRCFDARAMNCAQWRAANPDKVLESNRRQVTELTDSYVCNELRKVVPAVSDELVVAKRMQLKISRAAKTLNQTIKEK